MFNQVKDKFAKFLRPAVVEFMENNLKNNVADLALKYKSVEGIPIQEVLHQIQGKQKARIKIPSWYVKPGIIFPPTLNLEQSSSEITAEYKSRIIEGNAIADLTGGFGVDSAAFARHFKKVFYIERNKELSDIVEHNINIKRLFNIEVINKQAEDWVKIMDKVDCIYLDPARRDSHKNRVVQLADCDPNVVDLLPILFRKTDQILIKTSPLLDIKASLRELGNVSEVHVVAVENECKEVLYLLDKKNTSSPQIVAINIQTETSQSLKFDMEEEEGFRAITHTPLKYLYEPNAAILKAGAFNIISKRYSVYKLHINSHLYTSELLIEDFPGRKFEIIGITKYEKNLIKEMLKTDKANITVRNFPDSVEQIRKKTGIKEGGAFYLFATRDWMDKPVIVVTKKA